jgi:cytidylate kinase
MIKIVTIEREYGSGGGEIAQLLAKRLGWKLWDQLLTEEIARLANCPKAVVEVREERTDPLYYRLFKSFLRGSYEGSLNAHKLGVVDSESILRITERVVQKAASEGNCVIVGRGSQQFLKNRRGKSGSEAEQCVDTVDRERMDFIQKYFGVEWPDRAVYHGMMNTTVGDEKVVRMILDYIATLDTAAVSA